MSAELHLPDLPDVPVSLGPDPGAARPGRISWADRLRMALGTYLPLLMMVALALATWWLVKISPPAPEQRKPSAVRHDADYQLARFSMQRFDANGRLAVLIEGEQLRHYPDTDELEIDTVRITATAPDGRVTRATARHAVAAGDGSEARLEGDARIVSQGPGDEPPVEIEGQRLLAQLQQRVFSTDQPVRVRQGASEFSAAALRYDDTTRQLVLTGRLHAQLTPQRKGR